MKFIDLFAGLGGFHKALHDLGHECVFASEIHPPLRELYLDNWGIEPVGDIRKYTHPTMLDAIPEHDILCAGFPCQPFSKAGKQAGRKDKERGTLFDEIIKILNHRRPSYFILENVPYIKQHDNESTWKYMDREFKKLGYQVDHAFYSPQDFGIPQHRKRIFIVGSLVGLDHFSFADVDEQKTQLTEIYDFVETAPKEFRPLPKANKECLLLWQKFLNEIPKDTKVPGFPIWAMEFGANYPYLKSFPLNLSVEDLGRYKGNFGKSLKVSSKPKQTERLPSYARVKKAFPGWKKSYISHNRDFYDDNKKHILNVVKQLSEYESQSWQKLEWNVGNSSRKISDYIIQFRASGVRVKKADFFPSLVCTNTQRPIIAWQNRYITKEEGLRLQALEGLNLPSNDNAAFKALGNAVNAKIVRIIAEKLLDENLVFNAKNGNNLFVPTTSIIPAYEAS